MKDEKVSVRWRMLLACPLACIDIGKFWKASALAFCCFLLTLGIWIVLMSRVSEETGNAAGALLFVILYVPITAIPMIYFVRRWCIAWNKKMDSLLIPDDL